MTWEDLTEDERRFLAAWHAAPDKARWDAFAMLINGRQRDAGEDTKQEATGVIVPFDAAARADGSDEEHNI